MVFNYFKDFKLSFTCAADASRCKSEFWVELIRVGNHDSDGYNVRSAWPSNVNILDSSSIR